VKEYRGPSGDRRLWYDADEIENIMADELRRAGLLPDPRQEALSVDIEAFVETYLGLPFDLNAELDASVLGVTEFVPGKKPKISINRDLTGSALDEEDVSPGLVGRWRATVAHEACHVLLHRLLFELDDFQCRLFPATERNRAPEKVFRCLKRDVGFNRQVSDWREVQANMGMGVLLMPRPVLLAAVQQARAVLGIADQPIAEGSVHHSQLVALLAKRFTVSRQATRIRLTGLKVVHPADQRPLL
jgi:hypothetical protein